MIALDREHNRDLIGNLGDKFVLNILNEGRSVRRNFSPRSSDSFGNLTTKTASNGCLIIEEALAYLECTVQNYIDDDCWLIYAIVEQGEVLQSNGITAMQHRKSGSHY
jgi:flavin reductase (DIM6/NTAB) family NADH-FMN oxidoreductase RutF